MRADVVETDQIDILAAAVFCDFEQVQNAEESGLARQFRSNVGKSDGLDGVDLDGAFFHWVALTDGDTRANPETNRAGDFAAADAFAKAFAEYHQESR